jgi:hypothetical protein
MPDTWETKGGGSRSQAGLGKSIDPI